MRKEEYLDYINPADFITIYEEWDKKGKPKGNDKTYYNVWIYVQNAVKACIGSLQNRYKCKITNYNDKVLDATSKVIKRLLDFNDVPRNIVNMAYLPTLGVCFDKKAQQADFEDSFSSYDYYLEQNYYNINKMENDNE